MKRIALFVCLSALAAFGQGGAVTAVPTITNTRGEPVPYAKVAVCSANPGSAPATVCLGLFATISTDVTLGTPCATNVTPIGSISGAGCTNPGKSDGLGNVVAFAPAGQYWCEYFGGSISQPLVIPCFFASGGGGSAVVNCPTALNGSIAAFTSPTALSCDHNAGTDFLGNLFGQSWSSLGPVNGYVSLIGGGVSPGTDIKFKLPANTFRWLAPASMGTSLYTEPPSTSCAVAQLWDKTGQTTDGNGDIVDKYGCLTLSPLHGISFTIYNSAGLASGSTAASTDYVTVPFPCTIQAYNLAVDSGTITVKFWKIATGTAIPTVSNSISTSGVGIASGTAIHSTTLSDFTTTTVTANDIIAMNITAASGPTYVNGVLQCQ